MGEKVQMAVFYQAESGGQKYTSRFGRQNSSRMSFSDEEYKNESVDQEAAVVMSGKHSEKVYTSEPAG
jgi:hypothetical protein